MLGDTPTQMRIIKKSPDQAPLKTPDRNFTPELLSGSNTKNFENSFSKVPESPLYFGVQFLGSIPTSENMDLTPNAKQNIIKKGMGTAQPVSRSKTRTQIEKTDTWIFDSLNTDLERQTSTIEQIDAEETTKNTFQDTINKAINHFTKEKKISPSRVH